MKENPPQLSLLASSIATGCAKCERCQGTVWCCTDTQMGSVPSSTRGKCPLQHLTTCFSGVMAMSTFGTQQAGQCPVWVSHHTSWGAANHTGAGWVSLPTFCCRTVAEVTHAPSISPATACKAPWFWAHTQLQENIKTYSHDSQ